MLSLLRAQRTCVPTQGSTGGSPRTRRRGPNNTTPALVRVSLFRTIAIPIQRLTHPLLFTLALAVYVDFEEDGIQYTAALLVAAAPIAAGESVCVHYGESYAPHRTWDAADPCEPPRVHKVDLVSFLNQHCLLDLHDITHMCLARNTAHAAYSVLPDLPKQLPKTVIVD